MDQSTGGSECQAQTKTHTAVHGSKVSLELFIHGDDAEKCITLAMNVGKKPPLYIPTLHPFTLRSSRDAAVGHSRGKQSNTREGEKTVKKRVTFSMRPQKTQVTFVFPIKRLFPPTIELLVYPRSMLSFFHNTCPCS